MHPPEELGDGEPEDITDDKAEGAQEEGGAEDLPDGPQQWAPLAPFVWQEGLGLRGPPAAASSPCQRCCLGVPRGQEKAALGPRSRLNVFPQVRMLKS